MLVLGLDISRANFDAVLPDGGGAQGKPHHKAVSAHIKVCSTWHFLGLSTGNR